MKTIVILVVLCLAIQARAELKCYDCKDCKDDFKDTDSVVCGEDLPPTSSTTTEAPTSTTPEPSSTPEVPDPEDVEGGEKLNPFVNNVRNRRQTGETVYNCYKIERTANDKTTINRGCVEKQANDEATCKLGNSNAEYDDCHLCDSDECNTASGIAVSVFALIAGLFIVMKFN